MKDLSVVIPCYKEDETILVNIYNELTKLGVEVIIVDDGENMNLSIPSISYSPNMGYGYAIKRGILESKNSLILTMDGDGQHTVEDTIKLYTVFKLINNCDMLVGCRWNLIEKPFRWIGRKTINFIAACWSRHMLPDLNSGMRIFKRDLAIGYKDILCDTFSFTTSLTMALITDNHKVAWFPIEVQSRKYGLSRVNLIKDGFTTLYYIFRIGFALRTRKLRLWIRNLLGR